MPGPDKTEVSRSAFLLRPYGDSDFDALYEIDQLCYPPGIAYSKRMLRWFLHQPGAECLLVEIEGRVAGFILTDRHASEGHIVTIDVLEAYRRRGAGSALLRQAEAHLARDGAREVTLETATDNSAAVAFWHRHGYRTRGVLKDYYQGRQDAFRMCKEL